MDFLYVFLVSVIIAIGLQAVKERLQLLARGSFVPTVVALACVCVIGVESYGRTKLPLTHPYVGAPIDHRSKRRLQLHRLDQQLISLKINPISFLVWS